MPNTIGDAIEPMEGCFVFGYGPEDFVRFSPAAKPAPKSNLVINLSSASTPSRGSSSGLIDRAIVNFGEGRSLPKLQLFGNTTKLYIPQDGNDYAIVKSESQGEMPLNFKAEENGIYTLSISEPLTSDLSPLTFTYLHLIDNLTGNDVDLLQTPSYTFEARYTDYASRFKLVFSANAGEAACVPFAFISDGHIIVNTDAHGATLQMVDMMGRVIQSHNGDAMNRVSTVGMAPGVYVLRLVNGDDIKTQKIVIE